MRVFTTFLLILFGLGAFTTINAQEAPAKDDAAKPAEDKQPFDIHGKRDAMSIQALMNMDMGPDIELHSDISYSKKANPHRSLDIFVPNRVDGQALKPGTKLPVVVFLHGGNWAQGGGDKRHGKAVASGLCKEGYVVASITYRGSTGAKSSQYPRFVKDAAKGIDWVLENIHTYGGKADRIFIAGHSAGGHIGALLTYHPKWLKTHGHDANKVIAGFIGLSGIYYIPSRSDAEEFNAVASLLDMAFPQSAKQRLAASPIHQVKKDSPPAYLAFAENDMDHLDSVALAMWVTLRALGNDCHYEMAEEKSHVTILRDFGVKDDPTTASVVSFLDARVKALKE